MWPQMTQCAELDLMLEGGGGTLAHGMQPARGFNSLFPKENMSVCVRESE